MLSRSIRKEVALPLLRRTLHRVSDDFGVEDGDFGVEGGGLESGDDALSLSELTVGDEPSGS
jgi:hypothetical protein